MLNRFSRTELLLGEENMSKLAQSKIAIFGIGGVGSYVAEGLARCGIGEFILIDSDDISLTNINRQIHALETTIGQKKTLMMKERILAINPQAKVTTIEKLYTPESNFFNWDDDYTYIVDAVDDVKAKIKEEKAKEGKAKKEEMPQLKCTDISSAVFSVLSEVYNNSQVVCFSSNFSSNDPRLI